MASVYFDTTIIPTTTGTDTVDFRLYTSFMLLFTSTAIILNAMTMVMIVASPILRKKHNIFTFNLALSDCTASLVIMVQVALHYQQIENEQWWIQPTFNSALILSVLTTLAIALYRYIVFRFDPNRIRNLMSATVCIVICVAGWAIVLSAYLLVSYYRSYGTIGLVVSPILVMSSLIFTSICYIVIYRKIVVEPLRVGLLNTVYPDPVAQRVKRNTSILRTFAIIVVTNFACWVIICSILLMEYYAPDYFEKLRWFSVLGDVGFNLVCISAVLNPIIYWTRLTDFKRHLTGWCPGRCGGTEDTDLLLTSDSQEYLEIQSRSQAEENNI